MKKGVLVRSKRILLTFFAALLGLLTLFSYHNYAWYEEPIAKITAAEAVGTDATIGAGQEKLSRILSTTDGCADERGVGRDATDCAGKQLFRFTCLQPNVPFEDDEVFLSLSEGDFGYPDR